MRDLFKYVKIQDRGGDPLTYRSSNGHYLLKLRSPDKMPWVVRLILKGGRYGYDRPSSNNYLDNLTHKEDDPLVEFLDGRYTFGGTCYGLLLRRMKLSELRARPVEEMVTFQTDLGHKEYLSAENMLEVLEFCEWAHADSKIIEVKNDEGIPFNVLFDESQAEIYDARYAPTLGGPGMLLRRVTFSFLKKLSGPLHIVNQERFPDLVLRQDNIQEILERSGARCNEGRWVWTVGNEKIWKEGEQDTV